MLAIQRGACVVVVSPAHRRDGVAGIVLALEDAGISVIQVEPQVDPAGNYCLTVDATAEDAVRVLGGIGCCATAL